MEGSTVGFMDGLWEWPEVKGDFDGFCVGGCDGNDVVGDIVISVGDSVLGDFDGMLVGDDDGNLVIVVGDSVGDCVRYL